MAVNQKTNVIRILESQYIVHEVFEYSVQDGNLDAVSVAKKVGFDPDIVFKTLVTVGRNTGVHVFVIPGSCELDLKKGAQTSQEKHIEMVKSKDLLGLTGYIHGGCSPIGMKKVYPTYIEETALVNPYIVISAGKVGLQVKVSPGDLVQLTGAMFADLV